eukprot:XP_014008455.1 PREDICTED: mucin-6-like [Salmo salar]
MRNPMNLNVCKTFGSGVIQMFNGTVFYIRSTCPFTLTHFTHNRVDCDITMRRGENGLLEYIEINVNKIQTRILYNGTIFVEQRMVSLPYDHTYQHVFQYGINTKLRSTVLPLSVIWSSVGVGIDSLWVQLEQELVLGMTGLCGRPDILVRIQCASSAHPVRIQCASSAHVCNNGKWICSQNSCPSRCVIEGQFVTTFDGKQYALPGKCTYMASKGFNWTISIHFSERTSSIQNVFLQIYQVLFNTYRFSHNSVQFEKEEIRELHQSDNAMVFWQSSMYVQVLTSFGMKIQVQTSPDLQLYITLPQSEVGMPEGLCGNYNTDTTDDFTTSSGIVENAAEPFALSWSVGDCPVNIPKVCINSDNEIFADEKCHPLRDPSGIFAKCYDHVPTDNYHKACIQRTSVSCENNQRFDYEMQVCNSTCLSLSRPDPRCGVEDAPVEGCGCLEGTHLTGGLTCTPKAQCPCHHQGGVTPPGPVIIDGRQWSQLLDK